MKQKIKIHFKNAINWYEKNYSKIFFLALIHIAVSLLIKLPYINIVVLFFPAVIYFTDIIAYVVLFSPRKELLLYLALIFFIIDIPFSMLHLNGTVELFGNFSFILLCLYVIQVYFQNKNK